MSSTEANFGKDGRANRQLLDLNKEIHWLELESLYKADENM